ncbi:methyltransferase domain-containing protein [Paludisphaera sp.]|uniref:class I SAM-dependent methyltransferase n=1 Tax=Paludisphaera sp. TaxID=2017432 RepID=UPI00301DD05E
MTIETDGGDGLPEYAGMMADYHEAFEPELRAAVDAAGVRFGDVVVDVACGDGFYTRLLAERAGRSGKVVAVDASTAFLDVARRRIDSAGLSDRVDFVRLDLDHDPLVAGVADLVWCAQSLYSLPDPVAALRRLKRIARGGGRVAVFESDELHHVILPWPVDVELDLRRAELEAFEARSDRPSKYYVARDLPRVFGAAGLPPCEVVSFAFNRRAPFDAPTRRFLEAYLADIRERARPRLDRDALRRVEERIAPGAPDYLLDDPDALVICVDHLAISTLPVD